MAGATRNILSGHGPQPLSLIAPQGGQPRLAFTLQDPANPTVPLNLISVLQLQDNATYSDWSATGGKITMGVRIDQQTEPLWAADATVTDATTGACTIALGSAATQYGGLLLLEADLVNKDGLLVISNPGYLEVTPSLAYLADRAMLLSVPMIRRKMRDSSPLDNRILQEKEFTTEEIYDAINLAVQTYNDMPPDCGDQFSMSTFLWPSQLMNGIIANLLRTAALWYIRNDLKVESAGLHADDMGKGPAYESLAQSYEQRFLSWAKLVKRNRNISRGFSTVRSTTRPGR